MGDMGQRLGRVALADSVDGILLVCGELRFLQRHVRLAWRGHRFHDWMWLSTIVVLLGAKVNAELEHQTAQDTTEGADKPMGTRGAQMADSVGHTHAD